MVRLIQPHECDHRVCKGGESVPPGHFGGSHCLCRCHEPKQPEQLEFDLWVEERFSMVDMVHAEIYSSRVNYLKNTRHVEMYQSPVSMHTIVRYRV